MPKLLTDQERWKTGSASFISWARLATLLERAGETRHSEVIAGFTLQQEGGLMIYRQYKDEVDDDA